MDIVERLIVQAKQGRRTVVLPAGDDGRRRAAYAGGSGTAALIFAYEMVEPNYSTQGIAVLANTLQANGGAIRSQATGADAALAHGGLGHDPAH